MRIMSCFALGLGLPEDFFEDAMDPRHDDCGTVSDASSLSHAPSAADCLCNGHEGKFGSRLRKKGLAKSKVRLPNPGHVFVHA